MIENISLKIDGKLFSGNPIRVLPSGFSIFWDYPRYGVFQKSFSLRMGSSSFGLGTDGFTGNIITLKTNLSTRRNFKFSPNVPLFRSREIYGQIQIVDNIDNSSGWVPFVMYVNDLPHIVNASFSENSGLNNGIALNIIKSSEETMTNIRWYQNGVLQSYLNDYLSVPSRNIEYGDSWSAEVIPYDELENGPVFEVDRIDIPNPNISGSNVVIIPSLPNPDDILAVQYRISKDGNDQSIGDESTVDWYVNDVQVSGRSSGSFARLKLRPGDYVQARLNPVWSGFSGQSVFTDKVLVSDYVMYISNLAISGSGIGKKVSYDSVGAFWSVPSHLSSYISNFSIKIGTSSGSSNILQTSVDGYVRNFSIEPGLLKKGFDYYLSVAPVGFNGIPGNYETVKFTTQGDPWKENVDPDIGYTVLVNLSCKKNGENSSTDVLSFNIADGIHAYVIDVHHSFLRLNVSSEKKIIIDADFSIERSLIISVLNDSVFIYIDGVAVVSQETLSTLSNSRYLNIIPRGGRGDLETLISSIRMSLNSAFHINQNEDSNYYSFSEIIDIKDSSITDVESFPGGVMVAANNLSSNYCKTYIYKPDAESIKLNINNVDTNSFYVNHVYSSQNNKCFIVSTSRGCSIFKGDPNSRWDSETLFFENEFSRSGWILFSALSNSGISFNDEGLNISTLFEDVGKRSNLLDTPNYQFDAIRIVSNINVPMHIISVSNGFLNIGVPEDTPIDEPKTYSIELSTFKISELVSYVRSLPVDSSGNTLFENLYSIDSINGSSDFPAVNLSSFSFREMIDIKLPLVNSQFEIDPYVDNPQSSVSGGKAFISHSSIGNPWYDYANSESGYSIEFEFKLNDFQDGLRPLYSSSPDMVGLYINDGSFDQKFHFNNNGVYVGDNQKNIPVNLNEFVKIRISARDGVSRVWKKESSDNEFVFVDSFRQKEITNSSRDCRNHRIFSNGKKYYSLWLESNGDVDLIIYAESEDGSTWSSPISVPVGNYSIKSADIAVDSNGTIMICYETFFGDHSDIMVISKNSNGWSSQFNISNEQGSSSSAKICSDEFNNFHLVWSDSRSGVSEIYYAFFDAKSRIWNNENSQPYRVTSSYSGSYRPCVFSRSGYAYMSWTDVSSNGSTQIRSGYYNFISKTWKSSFNSGSDILVSGPSYGKADCSDIVCDKDGSVHFVWHDYIDGYFRIIHRRSNAEISFSSMPFVVTNKSEKSNSVNPKVGLDSFTGDLILVWQKYLSLNSSLNINNLEILANPYNPYDPYFYGIDFLFINEDSLSSSSSDTYMSKWSRSKKMWYSSGSKVVDNEFSSSVSYRGGFDIPVLKEDWIKYSVTLPKMIMSNAIIGLRMRSSKRAKSLDYNVFSSVYSLKFDSNLEYSEIGYGDDPYENNLTSINRHGPARSLIIGDMSDTISCSMTIRYLNYNVFGEKDPFSFRKVGYLTHTMSSDPVIKSFVADNGDSWISNSKEIYFYDYDYDQIFNSWDKSLADINNLSKILGDDEYYIEDFVIDYFGNFFVIVKINNFYNILISKDHIHWVKFTINDFTINNFENLKIAFNENGDMVICQSNNSCLINNYISYVRIIPNSFIDDGASSSSSSSSIYEILVNYDTYSASPFSVNSIEINDLKIDNNKNVIVSTNFGIFFGKIDSLRLLTKNDGLNSETVKSCHIINDFSRLCVFENSISKMSGTSFEDIDLISPNYVESYSGIKSISYTNYSIDSGEYIDAITYNKYIIIAAKNGIILFYDEDPVFRRRLPRTSFFNSSSLDFVLPEIESNFLNKEFIFSIPDSLENDVDLNRYLVEVLLNNNPISFGYDFSASQKTILFKTSLLPSDKISLIFRTDIKEDNSFRQNGAEIEAFGSHVRNINAISYLKGQTYAIITGSEDYVSVRDDSISLPYDEVILDRVAPSGKVKFISQDGPNSITLSIDPLEDFGYDETSGISSMVISNFDNFTNDGTEPVDPVPFRQISSHNLLSSLSPTSTIFSNNSENIEKLFMFNRDSTVERLYAISSAPIKIFERSSSGSFLGNPISIMENGSEDFAVGFVEKFGNSIVIGTRSISGIGQGGLYVTRDLQNFDQVSILPGKGATGSFVSSYDNSLYISTDGSIGLNNSGCIVKYDGSISLLYKSGLGSSVNCISGYERFLFVGTQPGGRVYRADLASGVVELIHIDQSDSILGIDTIGTAIFAGTSSRGVVIRSKGGDSGFIDSFRTFSGNANLVKTLSFSANESRIFAAINNSLYSLRNAWTLEGSADADIRDVILDENKSIVYCSGNQIKIVQSQSSLDRKVFVKLIDNAGNESDIRSSPDESPTDGYNDDLTLTLTENEISSTYLQSKLLEVDSSGSIVYSIDGDAPFYSAKRIVSESGVYYSEVFNGSTGHVSWKNINWDGNVPNGTYMKIYVRVADSRSGIESSLFSFEFDQSKNNIDISFLSGQYLQLKIELGSYSDISPHVSRIIVTNNAGTSSHFFTTAMPLPSRIKRGIISTEKILPLGAEIVIGISGKDVSDFSQYQIIPESRVFSIEPDRQGDRLKVGFRFITPHGNEVTESGGDIGSLPGFGSILSNSVAFDFRNLTGNSRTVDFRVEFFTDSNLIDRVAVVDTISSPSIFRVNGNLFPPSGGIVVLPTYSYRIHCIPLGLDLICDNNYYVKVSVLEGNSSYDLGGILAYRKICGVNFINDINFNYTNSTGSVQKLHFEVSFYKDEARTELHSAYFSYGSAVFYFLVGGGSRYPSEGLIIEEGSSVSIQLGFINTELEKFDANTNYYITIKYIDLFDEGFGASVESMNFTFRHIPSGSGISCGSQIGVPILQGFAFMFELEDGSLVKFNYLS